MLLEDFPLRVITYYFRIDEATQIKAFSSELSHCTKPGWKMIADGQEVGVKIELISCATNSEFEAPRH